MDQFLIRAAGGVGIGTAPIGTAALSVEGDIEITGEPYKENAGGWLAASDARIKTEVEEIGDGLEIVNRLRPVSFRYTQDHLEEHPGIEDRRYVNFIAQEFRQVFPESVEEDGEGVLRVDTYNVRPFLVAAVQELSRETEKLQSENATLQESNAQLLGRIEDLSAIGVQREERMEKLENQVAQLLATLQDSDATAASY